MDDLVITDGLHYKKFTDVPFTGKVTGETQGSFASFKDGKRDGPWVDYYNNGQIWTKGTWKDGKRNGPWVYHYADGRLLEKGTWKDGKKDGPWVSYNKDGTVYEKYTGTFKDGEKVD